MHGDSVCMRCFELKRSPVPGQSNLLSHAQKCWPPEELEALALDDSLGALDRRRAPTADVLLGADRVLVLGHIRFTGVSYGFGHVVRGPVHWLMTRLRRLYVIEQSHFAVSNQSN
jgi:hypothetical protein